MLESELVNLIEGVFFVEELGAIIRWRGRAVMIVSDNVT